MTLLSRTFVGRVIDVQENRMTAMLTMEAESGFPVVKVEGHPVAVGQVGSYMVVRQRAVTIIGIVIRSWQEEWAAHFYDCSKSPTQKYSVGA